MVIAGTWKPWMLTPSLGSSSLTSGATFSMISPLLSTTGVTFSLTPNSSNWMAVAPSWPLGIGTGNWPPARKSASWPDMAIRFGRASSRMAPFCSSASMLASTSQAPNLPLTPKVVWGLPPGSAEPLENWMPEFRPWTFMLKPRSRTAECEASITRTSTCTCWAGDAELGVDVLGRIALGDRLGAGGDGRRRDLAGEQHAVGEVGHVDVLARQRAVEVALQAVDVVADPHVDDLRQPVLGVVDQDVGDAERLAADVEAAVGGRHQRQGVGLGDYDLAGRIVEAERRRLVLRHHDGLAGARILRHLGRAGPATGPSAMAAQAERARRRFIWLLLSAAGPGRGSRARPRSAQRGRRPELRCRRGRR